MRRRSRRRSHRQSWLGVIAALALALAACGGADRPDPAAFDPDAHDLTQLVIWERSDSLILVRQNLPPAQQALIDQLLASELPGLDKYVVDLAAFPNPYRLQVIDYLRARYRTPPYTIVFNYPQIFDFHPADSDTDAYIAFKRALFGALYPRMAAMMDPGAPRLIDAREVLWGGVEVDGIPALEFPTQVSAQDAAAWMNDSDPVIGVAINGDIRAYPIRIIAWHEMVNDTVGGLPVSLAYCTLCGAPILYDGRAGDAVYRFGTSGLLYRSNKLMYDRTTETLWNQFSGEPVWGPLAGRGIRLTPLPAVHTTWGEWRRAHPGSTVLNIKTGFSRDYGPGVAYADYRTWLVELNAPDAGFLVVALTGAVVMISRSYTERVGDAEMDRAPMGTGAYRFVSHADDENFIFERHDEHFHPLDYPVNVPHVPFHKRLEVLVRPEVQSRLAGLEAGEIDTVPSLGFNDAEPFLDDPDFNVFLQPAGAASCHNVYPNLNNPVLEDGSPNPFLDQRVRLAANLALNRGNIINGLLSGTEEQALFTFSGAIGYPTPEQKAEVTFPYDPEQARALLAEAGYPDGFDTTLHIHGTWGQLVDDLSLIVQQDLGAVGIRLTIKPWAAAEYFTDAAVRARPGEPGLWWFFANTNPDVGSMINCCVKPSGPYAVAPGSQKILDMVAEQEVELDPEIRKGLITELFLEHAREATFIFVIEPKEGVITRGDINWPAGKVQRRAEALNFATQRLV